MEQIEQLELRIAELQEAIQRNRRPILLERACAVPRPAMFREIFLGLFMFTPIEMIIRIALSVGGLALTGAAATPPRRSSSLP